MPLPMVGWKFYRFCSRMARVRMLEIHIITLQFMIENGERHPRILRLCETTLRWHRLREGEFKEA
ncbi:hypothetical protein D9613_011946 [Agrocybe pediades]|uniref:Uncharacterized protein n=1 Tax=Agrocybe pediades TaxID=84607 RepID=A0A8H4VHC8_9AGAR|nr:hypothetical protein D9613_011946 [Agrocybe pediades]